MAANLSNETDFGKTLKCLILLSPCQLRAHCLLRAGPETEPPGPQKNGTETRPRGFKMKVAMPRLVVAAMLASLLAPTPADAHERKDVGPYRLVIGWGD